MSKFLNLTFMMAFGAIALSAQVTPGSQIIQTTGMVEIAQAETAQVNLLNPGVQAPALGALCSATVSFVDSTGTVLKSTTLTVIPGQSMSFSLSSETDLNLAAGTRREIRATVATPPLSATAASSCKVVPTLELIDTASGRTVLVLSPATTIPSILTPAAR